MGDPVGMSILGVHSRVGGLALSPREPFREQQTDSEGTERARGMARSPGGHGHALLDCNYRANGAVSQCASHTCHLSRPRNLERGHLKPSASSASFVSVQVHKHVCGSNMKVQANVEAKPSGPSILVQEIPTPVMLMDKCSQNKSDRGESDGPWGFVPDEAGIFRAGEIRFHEYVLLANRTADFSPINTHKQILRAWGREKQK